MTQQLVFRQGRENDMNELKELGCLSYSPYQTILQPEHWARLNRFLTDHSKWTELFNQSTCFVCEHKARIVGMAFIVSSGHPWDIFKAEWCYIRMVGVHPTYQGQGIGKILIQHCIDHAKTTNEKVVALHTSEFMNAARHIYEELGFKVMQEIDSRLGKRYWLYSLEL